MLTCLDCGRLFEESEIVYVKEDYGELRSGCPNCGESFVPTERCYWCGEWITDDFFELPDNEVICSECHFEITPCSLEEMEERNG